MSEQLTIRPKDLPAIMGQAKLRPYRTIDLPNLTIHEFWRGDPKKRGNAKELAIISYKRDSKQFKLQYYPLNGEIQVVEELTIDRIGEAVNELILAGFAHE